ncbi:MAG TPA: ThuA domain-containing protein [Lacipirellulaceae bacterium]|jgi:type 1 glutamine amidotransferase
MNYPSLTWSVVLLLVSMTVGRAALGDSPNADKAKLRVLIIDGFNPYHEWQVTTPVLKQLLEECGRFTVDVATAPVPDGYKCSTNEPPPPVDNSSFRPRFGDYDVVVGNYVGPRWPAEIEREFEAFVSGGHGFVSVHSADNAFPDWAEYNRICGLGGWYGRNEKAGPYVFFDDDGKEVRDTSPGGAGHHGPQHVYQIEMRDLENPITKGLPPLWMHTKDELYDHLRGPAEQMHILATAYSDPKYQGTGRHEPMLATIEYGKGRVFHTMMGHADYSMKCVGFATTLRRGTEWAATGKVTIELPPELPTAEKSLSQD